MARNRSIPLERDANNKLDTVSMWWYKRDVERRSYTTAQAAAMIGVSRQALYTWIAEGKIDAPKTTTLGQRTMRFWTKAQIVAAKKFKGTQKRGRVPKEK